MRDDEAGPSHRVCGLYAFYWLSATSAELKNAIGDPRISPGSELVLNLISCGLFGLYAEYRNQQIIDGWFAARGTAHEPQARFIGLMNLLALVTCFSGYFSSYLHQQELNRLASEVSAVSVER